MENWKAVVGWEGLYEVSDLGKVRGLTRTDACGRKWKGRRLAESRANTYGHLGVTLSYGRKEPKLIHRLVLEAFVGSCPEGMEGCHDNGIPEDNSLGNLRWDLPKGNMADAKTHGTIASGSRNGKYTKPWRTPRGDRHGSRTKPESLRRGANHPLRIDPSLAARGSSHGCAKLNETDIERISDLRAAGVSSRKIASWFSVSKTQIGDILRGKSWAHLSVAA